ncbi:hypothetical protein SLA2020_151820 [Shorea laevis]
MESSNLHHQQHHQLVGSSSPLATSSCYGVAPSISVNGSEYDQNYNGVILNSRQKNDLIQDHWTGNNNHDSSFKYSHRSVRDLNLAKIKEDPSSEYSFQGFTGMLNSPSSSVGDSHPQSKDLNDLSEKLMLQTISPSFPMFSSAAEFSCGRAQNYSSSGGGLPSRSGSFSQIYPSINISNLNQVPSSSSEISSSLMNLQALNLLSSARFNSSCFTQPNSFALHHMHHQPSPTTASSSPNKISSFPDEITEAKRSPSSLPELNPTQAAAKKSRVEPRNSCPPFKVRKEKLGDRIAALQQLVAPYGKTDTASVLMEAIGYIKFLQNQVETLSVPYMKSTSRNKTCRSKQGGTTMEEGSEEARRDLRSRGLCLVPSSFTSYVTGDSGGGLWPPPNFGGGT